MFSSQRTQRTFRVWAAAGLCAASAEAFPAGLELLQHGAKELGHGFAGTATLLEDSSAIAHNPAGLLLLDGTRFSGGFSPLYIDLDYNVSVQREKIEGIYGLEPTLVSGPGNASSTDISVVPHFYLSHRISEDAAVGLGVYVPFASGSDFPSGWAGRYHSETTAQQAVNINPAFAFRVSDKVSVGFGGFLQFYEATLTNQIDVGYLVAEGVIEQVRDQQGEDAARDTARDAVNRLGSQFDVENDVQIDSLAYGLNVGVLWDISQRTRAGLNFRTRTEHLATGRARRPEINDAAFRERLVQTVQGFTNVTEEDAREATAAAFDGRGAMGGDIDADVILPEILTLSGQHQLTEKMTLMGSVTWTNWSVFDEFRLSYTDDSLRGGSDLAGTGDDLRRRDLVQPLEFEDSYRFGLGMRYQYNDRLTWRAGASFDQSPLRNSDFRTPRGPDNDRVVAGLGASYQFSENLGIDAGYALIRILESDVTVFENPAGTQHRAIGTTEGTLHNLGLQANYVF